MIFTERTITVVNDSATINKPLILYRGDKNIELKITIAESQFKFRNTDASNVIETTDASYAQLVINTPYGSPIFSDVAATKNGAVIFVISAAMIDEIREVGAYEIQIRLLDDNKQSRASIPPVSNAIEIREPIAIENGSVVDSNAVNVAKVNRALTTTSAPLEAFDSQGNYIKKTWGDGDLITDTALNKMEAGIDGVNKKIANVNNINDTTASTTTTYSSNKIETIKRNISSQIKDIATSKLDKNEKINSSQLAIDKDADKIKLINLSDEVQQALTGNAPALSVIPNKSITLEKIGFVNTGKNLFNKDTATFGKMLNYQSTSLINSDDYYVSDYIEVEPNTQYTINKTYGFAYYNELKEGISGHIPGDLGGSTGGSLTITPPSDAKYLRFNIYKTLIDIVQCEKGAEATDYEEYYAYIKKDYVEKHPVTVDDIPDKSINIDKLDFVKYTKNLFNYRKVSDKGWYMQHTNGVPTSNKYTTELCYSEYIKVEPGKYIVNELLHSYCYFDENKKFISGAVSNNENTILTIPDNCKYVVVNIYYDDKEKYQLEKGTINTGYESYGYNLVGMLDKIEEGKSMLSLPEKYELVVGDTFELFYKGILLCNNPYNYNIKITCTKGSVYSKRYIFTPTTSDIGTHQFKIDIINDDEKVLDSKTINLVVKNKANSPTTAKNILCVGDSLTINGVWPSETYRRLTKTGGSPIADGLSNINFIGTCEINNGAKYEGYGGWNYNSYNSENKLNSCMWITAEHTKTQSDQHSVYKDSNNTQWKLETIEPSRIKLIRISSSGTLPSNGTLTWISGGTDESNIIYSSSEMASGNPFWNDTTGQVDFSNYANSLGVNSIDYCYVLLGWNQSYYTENNYKESVRIFIRNLLASFPTCKIGLIGLQVPSLDGFGMNYGCNWNYYDKLKFVFNVNQWYFDLSQEFDNVDFVNLSGQFDSENNMQTSTRQVNIRNSKAEIYGTNGVHPANEGYLQIADAVYRNLTHKL